MKKHRWRIYADANIEGEVVKALRTKDVDVLWVEEVEELKRQKEDQFHYDRAKQLKRYLLTRDERFWNDKDYPLHRSPGVIVLTSQDKGLGLLLILLLSKLLREYNPLKEPICLEGTKIKVSDSGVTIHMLDRDIQKKSTEFWDWHDLF